jgi:hypothetical protein
MMVRVNQRVINGDREVEAMIFLQVEARNMRKLHEAFAEDGAIFGLRFYTESGPGRGIYRITDVGEVILSDHIVAVQEMRGTLINAQGETVFENGRFLKDAAV